MVKLPVSVCLKMPAQIIYRQANLDDLSKFNFADELSVTSDSIEFNILGMGHELWIAVENTTIVGFTVLAKMATNQRTVAYVKVADSYTSRGIGAALLQAAMESHPESEYIVVPFEGTEEFYRHLGFERSGQWEMRREPSGRKLAAVK